MSAVYLTSHHVHSVYLFSRIDTEPAQPEVQTEPGTETSTEAPSDLFQASSQDPWPGQSTAAPPVIVDERFYQPTPAQLDWTWTPENSGEISAPQPQVVSISSNPPSSPAETPVFSPGYPPPSSVATAPSYPPVAPEGQGYHQSSAGGYTAVGYPPAAAGAAGSLPGPADKADPANKRPSVFTRLIELEKAVVEGAGATGLAAVMAGLLPELRGKK